MKLQTPIRVHAFNLVEIMLAMLVIGVALLAIIGLIPIGLRANEKAIGNNYAADAADQLLGFYADFVRRNWTTNVGALPTAPADISSYNNNFTALNADMTSVQDDLYRSISIPGVYRIKTQTNTAAGSQNDFDAIVRIWKTPTTAWEYSAGWTSTTDSTYQKRVQLNVEISWPAVKPYTARQKRFYVLEVSNPE